MNYVFWYIWLLKLLIWSYRKGLGHACQWQFNAYKSLTLVIGHKKLAFKYGFKIAISTLWMKHRNFSTYLEWCSGSHVIKSIHWCYWHIVSCTIFITIQLGVFSGVWPNLYSHIFNEEIFSNQLYLCQLCKMNIHFDPLLFLYFNLVSAASVPYTTIKWRGGVVVWSWQLVMFRAANKLTAVSVSTSGWLLLIGHRTLKDARYIWSHQHSCCLAAPPVADRRMG